MINLVFSSSFEEHLFYSYLLKPMQEELTLSTRVGVYDGYLNTILPILENLLIHVPFNEVFPQNFSETT